MINKITEDDDDNNNYEMQMMRVVTQLNYSCYEFYNVCMYIRTIIVACF